MQLQSYKSLKRVLPAGRQGYTLVELLVGVTIISIIFSIGYAGFREFSRRQAISGVTKTVKADLRLAQQLALTGQKPESETCIMLNGYTFNITSTTTYAIVANCSNANRTVKTINLPSVDYNISASPTSIQFKVLGQGTNLVSDNIITLSHLKLGTSSEITIGVGGEIN